MQMYELRHQQQLRVKQEYPASAASQWTCETCDKQFQRKGDLTRHKQLHTGVKPHVCSKCGKGFSQYSGLKTHMNVHTKDKPFVCGLPDCISAFGDPSSCARHRKETHQSLPGYRCPVETCQTSIKRRSAFASHLFKKHCIQAETCDLDTMIPVSPHREKVKAKAKAERYLASNTNSKNTRTQAALRSVKAAKKETLFEYPTSLCTNPNPLALPNYALSPGSSSSPYHFGDAHSFTTSPTTTNLRLVTSELSISGRNTPSSAALSMMLSYPSRPVSVDPHAQLSGAGVGAGMSMSTYDGLVAYPTPYYTTAQDGSCRGIYVTASGGTAAVATPLMPPATIAVSGGHPGHKSSPSAAPNPSASPYTSNAQYNSGVVSQYSSPLHAHAHVQSMSQSQSQSQSQMSSPYPHQDHYAYFSAAGEYVNPATTLYGTGNMTAQQAREWAMQSMALQASLAV